MSDTEPYTKVPNALLELLPFLPDAECRVMLVIARKTHGFHKVCDVISLSQLIDATGMARQGVLNGIAAATKRGILKRTASGYNNGYCYEIDADQVVHEVDHLKQSTKQTSPRSRLLVVHEVDHLGPQVVHEVDTQKKDLKEKKERVIERKITPPEVRMALADVCGVDMAVCSREQALQINTTAKRLHLAGEKAGKTAAETAETIRYVARWFKLNDWRGKKGNVPTPKQLVDVWGAAINARQPHANGHKPDRAIMQETDLDKGF